MNLLSERFNNQIKINPDYLITSTVDIALTWLGNSDITELKDRAVWSACACQG